MRNELVDKISAIVTSSESSESDIDHLMTLIRKLQERTNSDLNLYPLLSLFCDWTKHTTLDRKAAQGIVIELNEVLFRVKNISDNNLVINEISQVISFERLQAELRGFLFNQGLPTKIVTEKVLWLRFVVNLINIISDCELKLPENRRGDVVSHVKDGATAISLKYTWTTNSLFTNKPSTENVLILLITSSDTTTMILPCKVLGLYLTAKRQV